MSELRAQSDYLTVKQASDDAQISVWAIYSRIERGELSAYRFGTSPRAPIRIKRSDLEKAMVPIVPKSRRSDVADRDAQDRPAKSLPPRADSPRPDRVEK